VAIVAQSLADALLTFAAFEQGRCFIDPCKGAVLSGVVRSVFSGSVSRSVSGVAPGERRASAWLWRATASSCCVATPEGGI
jgi:hypothetical protein